MIYTEEDRINHIKEIQAFLNKISKINKKIPSLIIDGIYGEDTIEAVKIFQEENSLPVTGEVDEETWNELAVSYNEAVETLCKPNGLIPCNCPDFLLFKGTKGTNIAIVQTALKRIGECYINFKPPNITEVFDDETEISVKQFQHLCDLNETGSVDIKTWNMLAKTYNAHI